MQSDAKDIFLLSNTKARKDLSKQIITADCTSKLAKGRLPKAQLLCH
jgi:hypothetical protein